ncbi:hypothetical protein ACHAQK_007470 [Fusarium lateritium]
MGGYTRQKRGCLTCRQRKKKCDQVYPVCSHCCRLNLVCKREAPRAVEPTASVDPDLAVVSGVKAPRALELNGHIQGVTQLCRPLGLSVLEIGDENKGDLAHSRRAMMRYYTATLAFLLTTNLENNCFLSVILPMSFESPPLMYAVSAWASSHLALRDKSFKALSLRHRGYALARLQESMQKSTLSTEMCLAVTMVLCSMESISEATDSWYPHLTGAAAALTSSSQDSLIATDPKQAVQATFEGRWLLRNFAYHDIMMSVSTDCRPLIAGFYWESEDDLLADPYFGFASRLLYLISETSTLNSDFGESKVTLEAEELKVKGTFSSRSRHIEDQLENWTCPVSEEGSPLALLGESYRNAALIHLYRTLRRNVTGYTDILQAEVQRCVRKICKLCRKVSEGSLVECTLLFPLFMAGGEAQEAPDIAMIREKLSEMIRWRKFRNVEACLDVLDEVWRRRSDGSRRDNREKVDWLDVVKQRGWKLAIS